jgi:hypothetical protein
MEQMWILFYRLVTKERQGKIEAEKKEMHKRKTMIQELTTNNYHFERPARGSPQLQGRL